MSTDDELSRAFARANALGAGEPQPIFADQFYILAMAKEIGRLRGRITRQRRELRRLNKTIAALWAGARFQVNTMAAQRERAAPTRRGE